MSAAEKIRAHTLAQEAKEAKGWLRSRARVLASRRACVSTKKEEKQMGPDARARAKAHLELEEGKMRRCFRSLLDALPIQKTDVS